MADVIANGVRFNVQRLGHGERKLVFIHGILIDNLSSLYLTLAPVLSDRFSLILYDLRGHGRSEQPKSGYSLDQMTLDLRALLEALGLGDEKVTLVGNSSGVPIALAYTVKYPQQIEGLVLIDGVLNGREYARKILATLVAENGELYPDEDEIWANWVKPHVLDGRLDRDGRETKALLERLHGQRRSPLLETFRDLVYRTDFVADMRVDPPYEEADLRRIDCPVLAVYGRESELIDEARRITQTIPCCDLVLVDNAGHGVLRQAAQTMREALVSWMDGPPAGSKATSL